MAEKKYNVNLNMTGNSIVNVADPVSNGDAVNLGYVVNYLNQRQYKQPARAASTGNLTLSAPGASIDGVSMVSGDRFLAKNQSTGSQNGIYVWNGSAVAATRATDADANAEVKAGLCLVVTEGTTNADKEFLLTTDDPIVVGTTALTFTLVNTGGVTYSAGDGVLLTGTTFSAKPTSGGGLGVDSGGIFLSAASAGSGLVLASGVYYVQAGTGLTVDADNVFIDTSLTARWKSATAGNGSATTLTLTHNLGNPYHIAQVQDASTGEEFEVAIAKSSNTTTFTFQVAPATNSVVLVVVG